MLPGLQKVMLYELALVSSVLLDIIFIDWLYLYQIDPVFDGAVTAKVDALVLPIGAYAPLLAVALYHAHDVGVIETYGLLLSINADKVYGSPLHTADTNPAEGVIAADHGAIYVIFRLIEFDFACIPTV